MVAGSPSFADRLKAGAATLSLQLVLALILVTGLGSEVAPEPDRDLKSFRLSPIEIPVRTPPPEPRRPDREVEGGSLPDLAARPTEIARIAPIVPMPIQLPVVAAPIPAAGPDPSAGASETPGAGFGTGGEGSGTGRGSGAGSGDAGAGTPPRRIAGRIRNHDYPKAALRAGRGGTVSVQYRVEADGRVSECWVTASSGSAELDGATCAMIQRRFRFAPARDESGRAVRSVIEEDHSWMIRQVPPPSRDR